MDEIDIKILEKELPGDKQEDYIKSLNDDWRTAMHNSIPVAASERQVGGEHYKKYKIQPGEYCQVNGLSYMESNAIKYITRHRDKEDGEEDIKKAIHCLELLLEWNYGQR